MIFWLLIGLALIVLIAPLRKCLLGRGAWRITLPALGGAIAGWYCLQSMPPPPGMRYLWIIVPLFGAGLIAAVVSAALAEILGPPKDGDRR